MKRALFSVVATTLVAPFSGAVLAQENTEDSFALEEVIVTATRRSESLMSVTQSIQAISEAQLELPTFSDVSMVVNLIPGAVTFGNKQPVAQSVQIRGSGIVQSSASDAQSPVGYYVDDIPYVDISTPNPPPIDTFDLERIEILRGPQGTTYGQDSSAGSLIMRTNPVDLQNFGYKVRASYSQTEGTPGSGYQVGAVVNVPIVEDVFGVRLSYQRNDDPGYGEVFGNPGYDDPLANTRDTIRAKVYWQVSDNLNLELTHSEWNTEYNMLPGTQILDSTGGTMIHSPIETQVILERFPDGRVKNEFEISWTTFHAEMDLGFADLSYSFGFVDTPKKETNSEFIFDIGLGPMKSGVVFNQPAESMTNELRLVSKGDSKLQWLGGLFYLDAESDSGGTVDTPDFFFRERTFDPIEAEAMAVYGEVEYAFTDAFSASLGMRYHDEDRTNTSIYSSTSFFPDFTYFSDPYFGPQGSGVATTVEETSFDHTSYRIGLTWTPSDNGMVYITQSTANRAPIILTANDRIALANGGVEQVGDVDAAELSNFELGTKWTLADGRLQVEAAYVIGDWQDIPLWAQVMVPGNPVSMPIGGTDADVTSTELAITWAISDSLQIDYAYAYTDTEVTSIPDPGTVSNYPGAIKVGGSLYNYSPETHNIGVNWNRDDVVSGWDMYLSANYVSRDRVDGINPFRAPESYVPASARYQNLMLNLGVTKGPWDIVFSVRNAGGHDGQYLPRTSLGGGDAQLFGLIQQPTTYTLQVSYDGMP